MVYLKPFFLLLWEYFWKYVIWEEGRLRQTAGELWGLSSVSCPRRGAPLGLLILQVRLHKPPGRSSACSQGDGSQRPGLQWRLRDADRSTCCAPGLCWPALVCVEAAGSPCEARVWLRGCRDAALTVLQQQRWAAFHVCLVLCDAKKHQVNNFPGSWNFHPCINTSLPVTLDKNWSDVHRQF